MWTNNVTMVSIVFIIVLSVTVTPSVNWLSEGQQEIHQMLFHAVTNFPMTKELVNALFNQSYQTRLSLDNM